MTQIAAEATFSQPVLPKKCGRGRPPLDPVTRQRRIVDAACELFSTKGYAATSVDEISRTARVTKRAIYQLIGDKAALFSRVCAALCERGGEFDFNVPVEEMSLRDVLLTVAHRVLAYGIAPETLALNKAIMIASDQFPDLVVDTMNAGREVLRRAMMTLFTTLVEQERIAPVDPMLATELFYDTVVGNQPLRMLMGYPEPRPLEAEIARRVDCLLFGYFHERAAALA